MIIVLRKRKLDLRDSVFLRQIFVIRFNDFVDKSYYGENKINRIYLPECPQSISKKIVIFRVGLSSASMLA